jgi:tRNA 2-selenouridine synthase
LSVQTISASRVIAHLKSNDSASLKISQIVDARSPSEFALDHLPGSTNWPVLSDDERITVGTLYKQVNSFQAHKEGAALVAANISRIISEHVLGLPKTWQPMIYCWRGGKRSNSLATVLGAIGFKVQVLEGGYKAFRTELVSDMTGLVEPLQMRVVCGPTGSGKTLLLNHLKDCGAQVLDLEQIAVHRSSVLGRIPGTEQPSQKSFETKLWSALSKLDPHRLVFVESESRKIGNLNIPEPLIQKMRASPCVDLQLPHAERVKLLLDEYDFLARDAALFSSKLAALLPLLGAEVLRRWNDWIEQKEVQRVVEELLHLHYDPAYSGSIGRNFMHFKNAIPLLVSHYSADQFQSAALSLLKIVSEKNK